MFIFSLLEILNFTQKYSEIFHESELEIPLPKNIRENVYNSHQKDFQLILSLYKVNHDDNVNNDASREEIYNHKVHIPITKYFYL